MIVKITEDMSAYESKRIGNFTRRQLIMFPAAMIVIALVFVCLFVLTENVDISSALSCIAGGPIIICAIVKRDGVYLNQIILAKCRERRQYVQKRPFDMHNFYEDIVLKTKEEDELEQEQQKQREQNEQKANAE